MLKISSTTRVENILEYAQDEHGHVVVPDGVTAIEDRAFSYSKIESIELPKTLEKIGYCSFFGCVNLKSIEIPEGVKEIDYGAFSCCQNLEYVLIPKSVIIIKGYLFYDCNKLKKVITPLHLASQVVRDTISTATIEILR